MAKLKKHNLNSNKNSVNFDGFIFKSDRNTIAKYNLKQEAKQKASAKDMLKKFKEVRFKMLEKNFISSESNIKVQTKFAENGGFNLDSMIIDCESTLSKFPLEIRSLVQEELIEKLIKVFSNITAERNKVMLSNFTEIFNIDLNQLQNTTKDLSSEDEITEEHVEQLLSQMAS